MKILVTGVNGQLGYDVCKELTFRGIENYGAGRSDFDITNEERTTCLLRNIVRMQ